VLRFDDFQLGDAGDWSEHVTAKEVWWTLEEAEAEAEVAHLNAIADEYRYRWQLVRVRRRL
jgi:hypothetical protein